MERYLSIYFVRLTKARKLFDFTLITALWRSLRAQIYGV